MIRLPIFAGIKILIVPVVMKIDLSDMIMNNQIKNEELRFVFSPGCAFIHHGCVLHFS